MKRTIVTLLTAASLCAVGLFPLSAFEWDWGGEFANSTGYVFPEAEDFSQEDKIALWATGEEQVNGTTYSFFTRGSYLYTDERPYFLDLEQLQLKVLVPGALGRSSMLNLSLGRFQFSEPTGYILSHTADGASVRLLFPRVHLQADAAYTGLLLNPASDVRISDEDFSEQFDEDESRFGPRRMLTQGQLAVIGTRALQKWVLYGLAQFDMREEEPGVETIDSQYWGTLFSFKFGRYFYHDAFLTAGTAQVSSAEDTKKMSLLTGFSSHYLREDWLSSRFMFYGLAATPDAPVEDIDIGIDLPFGISQVRPLNSPSLGMVVDPTLDSLISFGGDYSFRPFMHSTTEVMNRFQPSLGGRAFYRIYKWNADWMELNEDSDAWFLGTEYNAGFIWRLFSDLSAAVNGAVFIPGTVWSKDADPEYMLQFKLSASF